MAEQQTRDVTSGAMNASMNRISELAALLREASGDKATRIGNDLKREVDKLSMLTTSGLPSKDIERSPETRRF